MINIVQWTKCQMEADRRTQRNTGHRFETIMENHCASCGKSRRAHSKCSKWFKTFLCELEEVMCERGYLKRS